MLSATCGRGPWRAIPLWWTVWLQPAGAPFTSSWTAWGYTFSALDLSCSALSLPAGNVPRAFPADFDYAAGAHADASLEALRAFADRRNPVTMGYHSHAAEADDFRYPLGSGEHNRQKVGTAYQPLDLLDHDCQSNKGLIRVLCRVAVDLAVPRGPPLVRLDIGIWWRLVKGFANGSLGRLGEKLAGVTFYMAPWHSYKYLALKIWDSLCTGSHTLNTAY